MGSPEDSVPPQQAQAPVAPAHPVALYPLPPDSFWARIKRHKVVEWTLAYVAFGYALLHGVQMLRETFDWPFLFPRLTVFGLVLGAPIAVTLAWYHGHRAQHRVSGRELSILIALLVVAGSVLWWVSRNTHQRVAPPLAATSATSSTASAAPFSPPPHSIAVLPFVNMSGDKEQEYFSEGLTEELLNSLSRINKLQVAARTSSFSFAGEHPDIATIAHKLNVGAVLEGSVRRSAHTVRVSAQLVNGVTGFHVWSQTYDRDLGDVLQLQTDIATAVAEALKVTLLGDVAARIELGGTRNPAAFDAYLRASKAYREYAREAELQTAIAGYSEAIRQDPGYALAFAYRSRALASYARNFPTGFAIHESHTKALSDANEAIALAGELAEAHLAKAIVLRDSLDLTRATQEYERALALGPGNAWVLGDYGVFAVEMGHTETGLAAVRHALMLDPLSADAHGSLGYALGFARRYSEAISAYKDAKTLAPTDGFVNAMLGYNYYAIGDFQSARTACESADESNKPICLAGVYEKLGLHSDAQKALSEVAQSNSPLAVATIYAQWGDIARSLHWLETAVRKRDPYLIQLRTSNWLDPLRNEPRFQAIERELEFPN